MSSELPLSGTSESRRPTSPDGALTVDEFQFSVAQTVGGELAARASQIFALARDEAQRMIDDLLAANEELRAVLSKGQLELAEVVASVRLVVDDRPDEVLARELAALVAGQVIEHAVSSASAEVE